MKKSLIVLLSALCVSGLNAQDYNLGGNKFGDNWSIGLNGGIATPLTHSTFFKNSRAVIGLDINKQLSPIYGLTLESGPSTPRAEWPPKRAVRHSMPST